MTLSFSCWYLLPLIMALWLLVGSQWLCTPSRDLMRGQDPREENKFNSITGESLPLEVKLKNEARGSMCFRGILESAC